MGWLIFVCFMVYGTVMNREESRNPKSIWLYALVLVGVPAFGIPVAILFMEAAT